MNDEIEQSPSFEHRKPDPLAEEQYKDFFVERLTLEVDDVTASYSVYVFTPDDEMPEEIAAWLHYRTMTEPVVAAENDGDFTRFKSTEYIKERFLQDKGGRTLYVAVDEESGSIDGIAWLHPLHNNQVDYLLVQAGRKALDDETILPNELATIATREYGRAVRKDMSLRLGALSIDKCFASNETTRGVVGIFGDGDNIALELINSGKLPQGTSMRTIENGLGWVILMAMRDRGDEVTYT